VRRYLRNVLNGFDHLFADSGNILNRMKVLFLYQKRDLASSRIRVLNLIPELEEAGINCLAVEFPRTILKKIPLFKKLGTFDCILLQKKLLSFAESTLLGSLSKKLVFDFDDAIYYRDDTHQSFESRSRLSRFRKIVAKANLIIAGNEVLSREASRYNRNIVTIPSAVEARGIPVQRHEEDLKTVSIGWIGGKGNLHHLAKLAPVLQRLSRDFALKLVILSDDSLDVDGVDVVHIPWRLETQEEVISGFDIGVMPLPNNPWTRGKCGYKALQYMASGVPAVVSDVGTNREIVTSGKEGFVAGSMEGFYDPLRVLIVNRELRKEMGARARAKVISTYSVEAVGRKLALTLEELVSDRCPRHEQSYLRK